MTQKVSPCIEKVTTHLYELEDRLTSIKQQENATNKSIEGQKGAFRIILYILSAFPIVLCWFALRLFREQTVIVPTKELR